MLKEKIKKKAILNHSSANNLQHKGFQDLCSPGVKQMQNATAVRVQSLYVAN